MFVGKRLGVTSGVRCPIMGKYSADQRTPTMKKFALAAAIAVALPVIATAPAHAATIYNEGPFCRYQSTREEPPALAMMKASGNARHYGLDQRETQAEYEWHLNDYTNNRMGRRRFLLPGGARIRRACLRAQERRGLRVCDGVIECVATVMPLRGNLNWPQSGAAAQGVTPLLPLRTRHQQSTL